jgi:hypothetical protein
MRYLTGLVIVIAAGTACARGNDRPLAESITSPTAIAAANRELLSAGVTSSPMVVGFPGRDQSKRFRDALETYYATVLGRSGNSTFVDVEGEIVWLQEYLRYRVNGCAHATAVARVLEQIAGAAAGAVCADVSPHQEVPFPARTDIFDARRTLETTYQQMGRALSVTAVDIEGAGIWISEYLRYRASGCDHDTAVQKVFSQIATGTIAATCFVPCSYRLTPERIASGSGSSSQTLEIRPTPASVPDCAWTARSTASWLTISSGFTAGVGFTNVPYTIAQNNSNNARTAYIEVAWQGGSSRLQVDQAGTPFQAAFTMVDPFRSSSVTTECWFRSSSTPCNFSATANLPGPGAYTYAWTATYVTGSTRTVTQSSSSSTFTFSDACGVTNSTSAGTPVDLIVTLTITDSLGNTITIRSGEGNQPSLLVRLFSC